MAFPLEASGLVSHVSVFVSFLLSTPFVVSFTYNWKSGFESIAWSFCNLSVVL